MTPVADIPLRGTVGEPVDFARTIASHGVAAGSIGERARGALTTTVAHMFRFDENLFDFYTLARGLPPWLATRVAACALSDDDLRERMRRRVSFGATPCTAEGAGQRLPHN